MNKINKWVKGAIGLKQLFFDDEKLFLRDNVRRCCGKAELITDSIYHDECCETIFSAGWVFKLDKKYRCIYFGMCADGIKRVFCAESYDGIHFKPEDISGSVQNGHPFAKHHIFDLPTQEIADIYEDRMADASQRYKMLIADCDMSAMCVYDAIFTSPDLLHWQIMDGASWGNGTEPLTGVFYNEKKKCHTVLRRPFWGIRKVGYSETKDFIHFSEYTPCLHQDAFDEPLAEIYGMKAFPYNGMFIGLAEIYCRFGGGYHTKYSEGCEIAQLTYSADGRYWLRSLREPFISGANDIDKFGYENKMIWVSQMRQAENGDILILTSATPAEHGHFTTDARGTMQTYRVREDGFIFFENEDKTKASSVATREKIWHGGEAHINITAKHATFAVYKTSETKKDTFNLLAHAEPVEGFGHEDCIPFSGDSTDWIPVFKSEHTLSELKGNTLVLEVKFTEGRLYSIGGDFTDMYNVDACRYRSLGVMPDSER